MVTARWIWLLAFSLLAVSGVGLAEESATTTAAAPVEPAPPEAQPAEPAPVEARPAEPTPASEPVRGQPGESDDDARAQAKAIRERYSAEFQAWRKEARADHAEEARAIREDLRAAIRAIRADHQVALEGWRATCGAEHADEANNTCGQQRADINRATNKRLRAEHSLAQEAKHELNERWHDAIRDYIEERMAAMQDEMEELRASRDDPFRGREGGMRGQGREGMREPMQPRERHMHQSEPAMQRSYEHCEVMADGSKRCVVEERSGAQPSCDPSGRCKPPPQCAGRIGATPECTPPQECKDLGDGTYQCDWRARQHPAPAEHPQPYGHSASKCDASGRCVVTAQCHSDAAAPSDGCQRPHECADNGDGTWTCTMPSRPPPSEEQPASSTAAWPAPQPTTAPVTSGGG